MRELAALLRTQARRRGRARQGAARGAQAARARSSATPSAAGARRRRGGGNGAAAAAARPSSTVGKVKLMARTVQGLNPKDLRGLVDDGKKQVGSGIVAIVGVTEDGKAGLAVGVTDDLTEHIQRRRSREGRRRGARRQGRRRPARHGAGRRPRRLARPTPRLRPSRRSSAPLRRRPRRQVIWTNPSPGSHARALRAVSRRLLTSPGGRGRLDARQRDSRVRGWTVRALARAVHRAARLMIAAHLLWSRSQQRPRAVATPAYCPPTKGSG